MTLGERLAELRARSGMSQDALAERIGVSRQSISKWETDTSVPDLDKLVKLSEIFGLSLDDLVKGAGPQTSAAASPERPVLWLRLATLLRGKGRLLAWLPVLGAVLDLTGSLTGLVGYAQTISPGAALRFADSMLYHYAAQVLKLLAGFFAVFWTWRQAGRLHWYHLGWLPVSWGLFGIFQSSRLCMGLLEQILALPLLYGRFYGVEKVREVLVVQWMNTWPQFLLCGLGIAVLVLGRRYAKSGNKI